MQDGLKQIALDSLAVHEAEELEDAEDHRVVVGVGGVPQLGEQLLGQESEQVVFQFGVVGLVVAWSPLSTSRRSWQASWPHSALELAHLSS